MPANWSMVDNSFPTFTGEEKSREQIRKLVDYMHILVEELKYQLANLDTSNWNGAALTGFQNDTTKEVREKAEGLDRTLGDLSQRMTDAETDMAVFAQWADGASADIQTHAGQIEGLLGDVGTLEQRMTDAENDIAWLKKDQAEAAQLLESHSGALAALQTDMAEFTQWANGVNADIQTHTEQIEGLLGDVYALEQRMAELEEQLEYLDGRMLEMELLTTQLHQEQTAHAARLDKLEKLITANSTGGGTIGTEGQDLKLYGNVYINGKLVE